MNRQIFSNIKKHLLEIWNLLQTDADLWTIVQSSLAVTEQHLADTAQKLKKYAAQEAEKRQGKMFNNERNSW